MNSSTCTYNNTSLHGGNSSTKTSAALTMVIAGTALTLNLLYLLFQRTSVKLRTNKFCCQIVCLSMSNILLSFVVTTYTVYTIFQTQHYFDSYLGVMFACISGSLFILEVSAYLFGKAPDVTNARQFKNDNSVFIRV